MPSTSSVEQGNNKVHVAICVATFRRPRLLKKLLDALAQLRFRNVSQPRIDVIVVDNDDTQSARSVCRLQAFPWKLHYVSEPRRGIVHARNRAIMDARGADFLAFIDDDEAPCSEWLDELLAAQSEYDADVVSGMVQPCFAEDVPVWVKEGGFFHRPAFKTGEVVRLCSTNNALLRTRVLHKVTGFDERFNLTGAEDTHFFLRVRDAGFRVVFCNEATVQEYVSADRANVSWLLRRGFQAGNSWALTERSLKPGPRIASVRLLKEIVHLAAGLLQLVISWRGKARVVRLLQRLASAAGAIAGVMGYRFLPYASKSPAWRQPPSHTVPEKLSQQA